MHPGINPALCLPGSGGSLDLACIPERNNNKKKKTSEQLAKKLNFKDGAFPNCRQLSLFVAVEGIKGIT